MPSLPRPYIPLAVRVQVAERQIVEQTGRPPIRVDETDRTWLKRLLGLLFDGVPYNLDHDPPLGAREKVFMIGVHIGYKPDANDSRFLIYRSVEDHRRKSNVRGDGAQHPDRVLIAKTRRLENPRTRPKAKIKGLTFQQQRCKLCARCRCDRGERDRCENYRSSRP